MSVLKRFRRSNDVANRVGSRFLVLFHVAALLLSAAANGQDAVELDEEIEEIIVTGSRIPRDEFTSPSPIQFLYIDEHRQIGVSSVAELLYRAPITNGPQIDPTLNTAATTSNATEESPSGGVGSSNISLRGLAPERTLVLVNGRRLGSVGVRGAPAQPDISMIPFNMIERVDVITEGVSAVYGADAVAGVVNVILRDQFEGMELTVNAEQPQDAGGETRQLSMMFGASGDRTNLMFGAEYYDRERIRTGDRDFTQCLRLVQITPDGERLIVCRGRLPDNALLLSPDFPHCAPGLFFCPMFYTPDGTTDIDIPNFASWEVAVPDPTVVDPRLEQLGFANLFYFDFYTSQDERRAADLVSELERISVVTNGTIELDWWTNEQAYFEGYYLNTQVFNTAVTEQIFPSIAGKIAQEDVNGNIIVDASGFPVLVPNPLNPFGVDVSPVVTLDSLPQTRDVEREQFRIVAGFRGDIGDSSWSYDGFYSYDRGIGFQAQPILFENHLILATRTLRLDADGNVVCGVRNTTTAGETGLDSPEPCVPLNMFDDDIYTGGPTGEGTFSKAEQDYLVGNRINRTVVEQSIRTVAAAFGAEYRLDEIDSQADITGVQGLIAAENPLQEGETIGERDLIEVFGEINVPLLETLQVDAALRYTDEENFGSETTWRGRISWAPLDYLTLSASAGTSFRAPNLREQFLAGQGGGVSGRLDPCDFRNLGEAAGIAGDDDPDFQLLINNCVAQGVAVFDSNGNGFADSSNISSSGTIATSAGGNPGLQAETSESRTATITFLQPWFDRFDFDIALSYWDIQINNTVEELDAGAIVDHCYTNKDFPDGSSPLCSRQTRAILSDGATDSINFFDISFVNIGEQTARGIDLNTRFHYTFDNWGIDLAWMTAMSWQLEQEIEILGPDDRDDNVGEIGTPEIKFTSSLSLRRNDWEILMHNRFIGDGQQDNTDDFAPCISWIGAPLCRDVDFVDSVWYTDLSLTYFSDIWSVTLGVNNLFDEEPPLITWSAGPNRSNAVTSSGYDFFGRSIFANAQLSF
jgi:iron complex outermembrane receptor protein